MGTELIVLSSDDEEDVPVVRPHKRIKHSDGDNDVLVIESMSRSESSKSPRDDDCVILNYDPANDEPVPHFQACEGDDLVVVAERGHVACRDFPHSRHICVKFPFSTSSHEKHCQQCFCYVCEIPAPCKQWGKGKNSMDHCHAVNNGEIWNKMRSRLRSGSRNRAALSLGPVSRRQMSQPQMRTYTQPPLRVTLSGGIKSPPSHTHMNTNVPLANQHERCLLANRPPYFSCSMDMGLANGPHGNRPTPGPVNMTRVGHCHSYPNVAPPPPTNTRPPFGEHSDTIPFTGATTATSQTMSYQPALNPVPIYGPIRTAPTAGTAALNPVPTHGSIRTAPTSTPRQGAMHKVPALQAAACESLLNTPGQVYQERGGVGSTVAPSNNVGRLNTNTQRVTGFGNDLMKGVTGQSHGQSTPLGTGRAEPAGFQGEAYPSGNLNQSCSLYLSLPYCPDTIVRDFMSEGSAQIPFKTDTESLYDPLKPFEMPLCNSVMVGSVPPQVVNLLASAELGSVPPQVANTQSSVQLSTNSESVLEPVAANRLITKLTPWWCNEPMGECDEDFWMSFIEATLPRD